MAHVQSGLWYLRRYIMWLSPYGALNMDLNFFCHGDLPCPAGRYCSRLLNSSVSRLYN
jgi:hypothetical protein